MESQKIQRSKTSSWDIEDPKNENIIVRYQKIQKKATSSWVSEDPKNENAKKSTTELKPLKRMGRKTFIKRLILPQNKIKDLGDYETQW